MSDAPAITEAQMRTLRKARERGFVMIYGVFSEQGEGGFETQFSNFDRRMRIDVLLVRGLLRPGRGFNQYVLTNTGIRAVEVAEATEARKRLRDNQRVADRCVWP